MITAFETVPTSIIQGKSIEIHLGKGEHLKEEIKASIFFKQRLMKGDTVEDAREQTELAYSNIQINLVELKPVKVDLINIRKNWRVWFGYQEEST